VGVRGGSVGGVPEEPPTTVLMQDGEKPFSELFGSLRQADHDKIYSTTTCWWTVGGEDFSAMAFCAKRMPDPFLFAAMLTGQFEAAQA
jgi:hypothetical protein